MDMDPRFHAAQAALAEGDVEHLTTLLAEYLRRFRLA